MDPVLQRLGDVTIQRLDKPKEPKPALSPPPSPQHPLGAESQDPKAPEKEAKTETTDEVADTLPDETVQSLKRNFEDLPGPSSKRTKYEDLADFRKDDLSAQSFSENELTEYDSESDVESDGEMPPMSTKPKLPPGFEHDSNANSNFGDESQEPEGSDFLEKLVQEPYDEEQEPTVKIEPAGDDYDYDIKEKLKEMGEISFETVKKGDSSKPKKPEVVETEVSVVPAKKTDDEMSNERKGASTNLRRNIREVMDETKLDESTLAAQRQEMERLRRVQEQQRLIREVQRQMAQERVINLLQGNSGPNPGPSVGAKIGSSVLVKLPNGQTKPMLKLGKKPLELMRVPKGAIPPHQKPRGLFPVKKPMPVQANLTPSVSIAPVGKRPTTLSRPHSESDSDDEGVNQKPIGRPKPDKDAPVTTIDISSDDDCIVVSESENDPGSDDAEDPTNSGMHTNDEFNQPDEQGRVVINVGHPDDEVDIYLAPQIARIIKPHQIGGIRFLYDNIIESTKRFETSTGFGCILAHSMGLGKTLQVVTFSDIFLRHTPARSILCIMPINTLQNWLAEYNMWLPTEDAAANSPLLAHGEVRPRNFNLHVLNDSHKTLAARAKVIHEWREAGGVLLIGYEQYRLLSLRKYPKSRSKKPEQRITDEDRNKLLFDEVHEALVQPGPDLVICDEGHRIKNSHASISQALKQMRTKRRVVLTGYPLQNNLMEYWCMVDFVRPNYLGTKTEFCNMFERPIQNGQCIDSTEADIKLMRYRAHVLHSLLLGFVQRRSHRVLQTALPQKEEYVLLVRMTPFQRTLYETFMNEVVRTQTVPNPLKAFAVCCKIWNHPDVLYYFLKKQAKGEAVDIDLEEVSNSTTSTETTTKTKSRSKKAAKGRNAKPAASVTPYSTNVSSDPAPTTVGNPPNPVQPNENSQQNSQSDFGQGGRQANYPQHNFNENSQSSQSSQNVAGNQYGQNVPPNQNNFPNQNFSNQNFPNFQPNQQSFPAQNSGYSGEPNTFGQSPGFQQQQNSSGNFQNQSFTHQNSGFSNQNQGSSQNQPQEPMAGFNQQQQNQNFGANPPSNQNTNQGFGTNPPSNQSSNQGFGGNPQNSNSGFPPGRSTGFSNVPQGDNPIYPNQPQGPGFSNQQQNPGFTSQQQSSGFPNQHQGQGTGFGFTNQHQNSGYNNQEQGQAGGFAGQQQNKQDFTSPPPSSSAAGFSQQSGYQPQPQPGFSNQPNNQAACLNNQQQNSGFVKQEFCSNQAQNSSFSNQATTGFGNQAANFTSPPSTPGTNFGNQGFAGQNSTFSNQPEFNQGSNFSAGSQNSNFQSGQSSGFNAQNKGSTFTNPQQNPPTFPQQNQAFTNPTSGNSSFGGSTSGQGFANPPQQSSGFAGAGFPNQGQSQGQGTGSTSGQGFTNQGSGSTSGQGFTNQGSGSTSSQGFTNQGSGSTLGQGFANPPQQNSGFASQGAGFSNQGQSQGQGFTNSQQNNAFPNQQSNFAGNYPNQGTSYPTQQQTPTAQGTSGAGFAGQHNQGTGFANQQGQSFPNQQGTGFGAGYQQQQSTTTGQNFQGYTNPQNQDVPAKNFPEQSGPNSTNQPSQDSNFQQNPNYPHTNQSTPGGNQNFANFPPNQHNPNSFNQNFRNNNPPENNQQQQNFNNYQNQNYWPDVKPANSQDGFYGNYNQSQPWIKKETGSILMSPSVRSEASTPETKPKINIISDIKISNVYDSMGNISPEKKINILSDIKLEPKKEEPLEDVKTEVKTEVKSEVKTEVKAEPPPVKVEDDEVKIVGEPSTSKGGKEDTGIPYDWAKELLKDYVPGCIENSAKMEILFCIIKESLALGDRLLVFSQSLITLDLIEQFLQMNIVPGDTQHWAKNVNYYRLDGSTSALEREKLINEFNSNPKVHLFLVSTRAGSLGINLVGANRVIVLDASWNPCHDTQAVCRVYRYGQRKPCFVYRLVVDNCLEKKIYDRQINKQGMSDRVVDECNPDAHLTIKDVSTLCWDDEQETEEQDWSHTKDNYIDVVLQKVLEQHGRRFNKEPFQHESLLIDRKDKQLSQQEKRLAKKGYEREKQAARQPAYNLTGGARGHRPVASVRPMQQGGERPTRWIPAEHWQRQGMTAQEMTLPLDVVIPTNQADKGNIVLKAGQKVLVLKSPKGVYMQLESGKIVAIKTAIKVRGKAEEDANKVKANLPPAIKNNSAISVMPQKRPNAAKPPFHPGASATGVMPKFGMRSVKQSVPNLTTHIQKVSKKVQMAKTRPYHIGAEIAKAVRRVEADPHPISSSEDEKSPDKRSSFAAFRGGEGQASLLKARASRSESDESDLQRSEEDSRGSSKEDSRSSSSYKHFGKGGKSSGSGSALQQLEQSTSAIISEKQPFQDTLNSITSSYHDDKGEESEPHAQSQPIQIEDDSPGEADEAYEPSSSSQPSQESPAKSDIPPPDYAYNNYYGYNPMQPYPPPPPQGYPGYPPQPPPYDANLYPPQQQQPYNYGVYPQGYPPPPPQAQYPPPQPYDYVPPPPQPVYGGYPYPQQYPPPPPQGIYPPPPAPSAPYPDYQYPAAPPPVAPPYYPPQT